MFNCCCCFFLCCWCFVNETKQKTLLILQSYCSEWFLFSLRMQGYSVVIRSCETHIRITFQLIQTVKYTSLSSTFFSCEYLLFCRYVCFSLLFFLFKFFVLSCCLAICWLFLWCSFECWSVKMSNSFFFRSCAHAKLPLALISVYKSFTTNYSTQKNEMSFVVSVRCRNDIMCGTNDISFSLSLFSSLFCFFYSRVLVGNSHVYFFWRSQFFKSCLLLNKISVKK